MYSHKLFSLIFFLLFSLIFSAIGTAISEENLSPRTSGDTIILENTLVSYSIGMDGLNRGFIDKSSGKDYLDKNMKSRFMSISMGQGYLGASKVEYANNYLFVTFGITDICARIHVRILPDYITFTVISINNQSVSELQLANLPLTNSEIMSSSLTCTRDENFAGCILPLNIITTSDATKNVFKEAAASNVIPVDIAQASKEQKRASNSLVAWCDSRVKLESAKIALIGCPAKSILDVIERVEIENGLPHPTLGGVWARKAKENRQSYLFIDFSESSIDKVIDYARAGGFGYIMVYDGVWSSSHGSYTLNRSNFPSGESGLKKAVEKIHAAGIKAGVHSIDRVISKNDPLVHPIPHPGLLKRWKNERILEKDINDFVTFIPSTTSPKGLLEKSGKHRHFSRDLQIDNEIITYDDIQTTPPYGFIGCKRGAYGTHPANHTQGAKIMNLAEFIGFFEPDVESDLYDIVAKNMARVMDYYEFDMIDPDGVGENLAYYDREPHWYIANLAVGKLYNYTKREILWQYNPVSNWSWHIFSTGNTTDFVTRGLNEHFDIVSIDGRLNSIADFIPYEFGWFGFFGKEIDRDATMPREIEYAYSKACAYYCAMSIETNLATLEVNGRTKEIFGIMKNWEELKFNDYLSPDALEKIRQKGTEFTLDKDNQGNRVVRQIVYGPEKYVAKIDGVDNSWNFENKFGSQPLRVSIKSMPRLAEYGDPENKTLIKLGPLNVETSVQGPMSGPRNSEGTQLNLTLSKEQVKLGEQSFKVTAANTSGNPDGWGCVEIILDRIQDLTQNRSMGTWVYGDGSGVPLHFVLEDNGRWAVRDWWVKLDFKGWKYVLIPEPAEGEVYGFNYPYSSYWPIRHINYSQVTRAYVFLTNISPKQSVTCYFTQLEALKEKKSTIENPCLTIGSQSIMFPITLNTEDYLEYTGSGKFRAFDSFGKIIAEKEITGSTPVLAAGQNKVVFTPASVNPEGQAAKIEIITVGEPFK